MTRPAYISAILSEGGLDIEKHSLGRGVEVRPTALGPYNTHTRCPQPRHVARLAVPTRS